MADSESKFMEICEVTDRQVATYYMELCAQDLDKAVNLYYEDNPFASKKEDAETPKPHDENAPRKMTVLQWNLQGLLSTELRERTEEVVLEIERLKPDIVLFQEVIIHTLDFFRDYCEGYRVFSYVHAHYFAVILIRKSTFEVGTHSGVLFPSSDQGRALVTVTGKCCGLDVTAMTSHLESMKEGSEIRMQQFVEACESMSKQPAQNTVIFGADTNLKDREYQATKQKSKVVEEEIGDIWEMLGSPEDCRYSWDLVKNDNQVKDGSARLRYERVYTRKELPTSTKHFQPVSMKFLGTERLPCGLFISDHWGILVTFEAPSATTSD